MVFNLKSMKTAMKTAMKAVAKTTTRKTTSTRKLRQTSDVSMPKLQFFGAALVLLTAYFLLTDNAPAHQLLTNAELANARTIRLNTCGIAKPTCEKCKKKGTYKSLQDLEMAHSQLGFAASELIERVARPLSTVHSAANKTNSTQPANCTMDGFVANFANLTNTTSTTQPLGYTLSDSFSNFTKLRAAVVSQVKNVTSTACAVAKGSVNATMMVGKCAALGGKKMLATAAATFGGRSIHAQLKTEFRRLMNGPHDGPLRFSVNDAVEKMRDIFSHCNVQLTEQTAVAKRFPSSTVVEVAPAKNIYTTTVADGWKMEARVVNGLWTNVMVTKNEFELALKRDKAGLIHAFANGMKLEEI